MRVIEFYGGNCAGRISMSVETFTPTGLEFTQGAAQKVKTLVNEEGNERLKLRVFVTGGGCSGFQYGFTFDEDVAEDDTIVEREGVSLVAGPEIWPLRNTVAVLRGAPHGAASSSFLVPAHWCRARNRWCHARAGRARAATRLQSGDQGRVVTGPGPEA